MYLKGRIFFFAEIRENFQNRASAKLNSCEIFQNRAFAKLKFINVNFEIP